MRMLDRPARPTFIRSIAVLAAAAAAAHAGAEPARYELDSAHSFVAFLVEHVGFARVLGTFREIEGSYVFDEETGAVRDVEVTLAAASVSSDHEARDEHLRSKEFLDADAYPDIRFVADGASRVSEREFEIDGQLTLLGVTRPLTLRATWNKSDEHPLSGNAYAMGVSARGSLDRGEFGMDYALANGWVGNEVEMIIEFEALRQ